MRRRLGVSPGPVALNGPVDLDVIDDRQAVHVLQIVIARAAAAARPTRAEFLRDEGDADRVRPGLHLHARLQPLVERFLASDMFVSDSCCLPRRRPAR